MGLRRVVVDRLEVGLSGHQRHRQGRQPLERRVPVGLQRDEEGEAPGVVGDLGLACARHEQLDPVRQRHRADVDAVQGLLGAVEEPVALVQPEGHRRQDRLGLCGAQRAGGRLQQEPQLGQLQRQVPGSTQVLGRQREDRLLGLLHQLGGGELRCRGVQADQVVATPRDVLVAHQRGVQVAVAVKIDRLDLVAVVAAHVVLVPGRAAEDVLVPVDLPSNAMQHVGVAVLVEIRDGDRAAVADGDVVAPPGQPVTVDVLVPVDDVGGAPRDEEHVEVAVEIHVRGGSGLRAAAGP